MKKIAFNFIGAAFLLLSVSLSLKTLALNPVGKYRNLPTILDQPSDVSGDTDGKQKISGNQDSLDLRLDMSNSLIYKRGFLPMIMPITEPAVGFGLVAAPMFMSIPKGGLELMHKGVFVMPNIYSVLGGATVNGTWMAAGMYMGNWKLGKYRYLGVLGYARPMWKYYGSGNYNIPTDSYLDMTTKSLVFVQKLQIRLGQKSKEFLGLQYRLAALDNSTDFNPSRLDTTFTTQFESKTAGLGIVYTHDGLDNTLSPRKGLFVNLNFTLYNKYLLSDFNFEGWDVKVVNYFKIKDFSLGIKVQQTGVTEKAPFYNLPFISNRGVAAMRYQGNDIFMTDFQGNYLIGPAKSGIKRWDLVAFLGTGQRGDNIGDMFNSEVIWSEGAGFRYLIARKLGLQIGLDVAHSPGQWACYIVFGNSWTLGL
jgi:hypothetical protein